jgi:beta-phosphoglucomutase-like phosphatase (HAD superfamily)
MTIDILRIKALCFDVDGTLSDTDDLYVHKVTRFFPRFLFKDPDHTARRFVMWVEAPGNALLGFTDTIGMDDEIVAIIDWLLRHRTKSAKTFWLIPGVDEMLKEVLAEVPVRMQQGDELVVSGLDFFFGCVAAYLQQGVVIRALCAVVDVEDQSTPIHR